MKILPQYSAWFANAKAAALATEKSTGLPWQITLTQAVLESGWGQHQPGLNCFGIKAYDGCYGTQLLWTHEQINGKLEPVQRSFATFQTLQDCFAYHAQLIMHGAPYRNAVDEWLYTSNRTPEQLMALIGPIYATDPNYVKECLEIMAELKHVA